MVTVERDPVLDEFKNSVVRVVNSNRERGLTFGYPSGGKQTYERPSQVPLPLHLMGRSAKSYVEELGRELGVTFEEDPIYGNMLYRGVKGLRNPVSGATYKFEIFLHDLTAWWEWEQHQTL